MFDGWEFEMKEKTGLSRMFYPDENSRFLSRFEPLIQRSERFSTAATADISDTI